MRVQRLLLPTAVLLIGMTATGCGTFTGIPAHGGGKRFSVEQEVISGSARAAVKSLDLKGLKGERCALYVITMGDEGAGNYVGGRYQWQAAIRGEFRNSPDRTTESDFPVIPSVTETFDSDGNLVSRTESDSVVNFPSKEVTETEGFEGQARSGVEYSGPGQYRAEAFINPDDARFLRAVINEGLMLKGVVLVPPEQADYDIYVTVDVFGTRRRRKEFHAYNEERLLAKTAFQITAFDRQRNLVYGPKTASWEAEYVEKYVLWNGPFEREKEVRESEPLLADFSGIPAAQAAESMEGEAGPPPQPGGDGEEKTRTKPETKTLPRPDTFRPEDLRQPEQDE